MKRTSLVAATVGDDPLSMLAALPGGNTSNTTSDKPPTLAAVREEESGPGAASVVPHASPLVGGLALSPSSPAGSAPMRGSSGSTAAPTIVSGAVPSGAALPVTLASRALDPDDIIVDSARARDIATRVERKEAQPLYVGGIAGNLTAAVASPTATVTPAHARSASSSAAAAAAVASPARPVVTTPAASAAAAAAAAATKATPGARRNPAAYFKASSLPQRVRDWTSKVTPQLSRELLDDWDSHGRMPGERPVMQIPEVVSYNAHDEVAQVVHSLYGTLYMTSYQLYLEPALRRDRLGSFVQAIPLSTIDRIEIEKSRTQPSSSGPPTPSNAASGASGFISINTPTPLGPHHLLNYLDIYSKDGRYLKFGFLKFDECKRAYDCLNQYVFPAKEEYLFAFYYKLKVELPPELDGWNIYDPLEEFKRQGIETRPLSQEPPKNAAGIPIGLSPALTSEALRLSWANESFTLCPTYPRVFVVPSEKYVTDVDLLHVAQFRSRGRIPVCTWKHPLGRQTIWRCSQPRVGMNNARCVEDERLLSAISSYTQHGELFAIFDARPKFNARANILAGKGFENPELYKNCVKKIFFCDIQNIHVARDSHNKLTKACQKEVHDFNFLQQVTQSGWLNHIASILKAAVEMVRCIDQEKISVLVHCSDGWDRTAQLASLVELCVDPFYRTTRGFFVLIEKEWISYGHQFQRRTGHKDKNYTDDQRSCIFLQWCDTVYQLLQQFPRHFEFNSHLLVTMVHHLYSCRFGTFFYNSDMARRKAKVREKTVSLWTYFMCSPAAVAGEFTNHLYSKNGDGSLDPTPTAASASNVAVPATAASATAPTPIASPPPAPEGEEMGKSSVGRGGGDGSKFGVGAVLYPSYSFKRLSLWSDYFLRFGNEQVEQIHVGANAGSVPPFGATSSRIYSNEAALQGEIRRVAKENIQLEQTAQEAAARVRELEQELAALRAKYHIATDQNEPANGSTEAAATEAAESLLLAPSVGATAEALALASGDGAGVEATPRDETEALLRQRLQKDVDPSVVVRDEPGEDPRTL